ncbi:MAG TPA: sugar ABC transporter permease [Gryllotalpicola sp.]
MTMIDNTGAGALPGRPRSERDRIRRRPHRASRNAFLSPALILIGVFTIVPIVLTFIISFSDWSMLTPLTQLRWVGLKNYGSVLTSPSVLGAFKNTVIYVAASVVITVPLAMAFALLLYTPVLRGRNIVRALLFATYVVPTTSIVIVWSNIYASGYGPLSTMLSAVGIHPPGWLSDPRWSLYSLVIFNVWQMLGYYVVLLIAGLTQVPEELYEAAKLDGAGFLRQTWSVTLPLVRRSLFFVGLMTLINSIQVFDPVYLLTQGGPAGSTETISYDIQRAAFQYGQAGQASAMAVTLFMLLIVVGVIISAFMRRRRA